MSDKISEKEKFIEDVGLTFDKLGVGRTPGRVIGALMISNPPEMNMTQLTKVLQMSKASVSNALNQLLTIGFVSKLSIPGKRADFYQINNDFYSQVVHRKEDAIMMFREILSQALKFLENDDYPERKNTLKEMKAMYGFFDEKLDDLFDQWEEKVKSGDYEKYL